MLTGSLAIIKVWERNGVCPFPDPDPDSTGFHVGVFGLDNVPGRHGMLTPEAIWNRAAREEGGPRPLRGDMALTAVLRLHSLAMSGGVLAAVERLTDPELDAAESGYTWLGLAGAAQVIALIRDEVRAGALDDDDRAEQLEHEADQRYADTIPADAPLHSAFRRQLAEEPSAFASTRE